jgi:hypothetical protein
MITAIDRFFDLQTVIWLFPVVFMLHDLEEIIMVEAWVKRNKQKLYQVLPRRIAANRERSLSTSTSQFPVAVTCIFLFVSASAFVAAQLHLYGFLAVCLTVFFIHVFTHLVQMVLFKGYTPGVLTSVLTVLLILGMRSTACFNPVCSIGRAPCN